MEQYGVSRVTVREAMRSLEKEGLIHREAGRGTFVSDQLPFSGTLELDQSIDELISMGLATKVRLLELGEVAATEEKARQLEVDVGSPLFRCKRLRLFEGEPYCYIVNSMPPDVGQRIEEVSWTEGSVLKFIEEKLGIPLRVAEQRFRASLADANLARWLKVRIGAPLLVVDYLIRTDDDRPVEVAQLYYRSDVYSFTLHLTRSGESTETTKKWALEKQRFEH